MLNSRKHGSLPEILYPSNLCTCLCDTLLIAPKRSFERATRLMPSEGTDTTLLVLVSGEARMYLRLRPIDWCRLCVQGCGGSKYPVLLRFTALSFFF
jgi:hypothetical protein